MARAAARHPPARRCPGFLARARPRPGPPGPRRCAAPAAGSGPAAPGPDRDAASSCPTDRGGTSVSNDHAPTGTRPSGSPGGTTMDRAPVRASARATAAAAPLAGTRTTQARYSAARSANSPTTSGPAWSARRPDETGASSESSEPGTPDSAQDGLAAVHRRTFPSSVVLGRSSPVGVLVRRHQVRSHSRAGAGVSRVPDQRANGPGRAPILPSRAISRTRRRPAVAVRTARRPPPSWRAPPGPRRADGSAPRGCRSSPGRRRSRHRAAGCVVVSRWTSQCTGEAVTGAAAGPRIGVRTDLAGIQGDLHERSFGGTASPTGADFVGTGTCGASRPSVRRSSHRASGIGRASCSTVSRTSCGVRAPVSTLATAG